MVTIAEEAGFIVVNLADWADGHTPAEVKLSRADQHPNALGHRIIAERPYANTRQLVTRHVLSEDEYAQVKDRVIVTHPL